MPGKLNFLVRGGADFSAIKKEFAKTQKTFDGFQKDVKSMQANISNAFRGIAKAAALAVGAVSFKNFIRESHEAYKETAQNETKLATVMRTRMKATDGAIRSMLEFIQAEQRLGVVSADAMAAGAQELATYTSEMGSLRTLIPVLNNIAAQQYGVDVTGSQLQQTATMLGKVIDGQLGGLSRWGYSWSEAEEQILLTGTEMERAAVIAKVVGDSVGEMNYALAQTDVGRQRQLANTMSDVKAEFGAAFQQISILFIPVLKKLAEWLAVVANLARQAAQWISLAFGKQITSNNEIAASTNAAAEGEEALGEAIAGTAAEVRRGMAGFDQLTKLADSASDAAGEFEDLSGAGISSVGSGFDFGIQESIDTSAVDTFAGYIKNTFMPLKTWFEENFTPVFRNIWADAQPNIENLKANINTIFSDISSLGQPLKDWFNNDFTPFLKQTLSTWGAAFNGLFDSINIVFGDIWNTVFAPWLNKFITDGLPAITQFATGLTAELENNFGGFKQWFDDIWDQVISPFLPKIEQFGSDIAESFQTTFTSIYDSAKMVFDDIIEFAIKPLADAFADTLQLNILPVAGEFVDEIIKTWDELVEVSKVVFGKIWSEGIAPALNEAAIKISEIWKDIWQSISEFWDKWGKPIFDNVREAINGIGKIIINLWDNILKPIVDKIMKAVDGIWITHLKPLLDNILDFVGEIINSALELINKFILPLIEWFVEKLSPAIIFAFGKMFDTINTTVNGIIDILSGIITTAKGVIKFITGIFTGDWEKAWEGVKDIFGGIWDTLSSLAKTPLNLIIDGINTFTKGIAGAIRGMINTVVKGINKLVEGVLSPINLLISGLNLIPGMNIKKLSFTIPSVPSFSEAIPQIPKLAAGTVAAPNNPFLAMIGDNRHEPEIVSPVSTMKQAIREVLDEGGDSETVSLLRKILDETKAGHTIEMDGQSVVRIGTRNQSSLSRQWGVTLLPN